MGVREICHKVNMDAKNVTRIRTEALSRLHMAFGVMTVIPLLICAYLITVRFFTLEILVGLNGVYFLLAIIIALIGLLGGRNVILNVVQKLAQASSELEQTVAEEIALNQRLKEEISKRVRAQESLRIAQDNLIQAAKMESVGRLAAGAAHEVKNPLAMLLMGVDYMKKTMGDQEGKTKYMLGQMDVAIKRTDQVMMGLLDYASIKELKLKQENLHLIIDVSLSFVKHELDNHHIRVVKDIQIDPLLVRLDRNRIEQVFVNIFTNAIQAMPDGGDLTIKTRKEELRKIGGPVGRRRGDRFRPGDTAAIVQVDDTGKGIPEEDINRIFDPFFTTKRGKGGTGLGLSVIRSIIDMHNGSVEIRNREDRGARVTIMLKSEK